MNHSRKSSVGGEKPNKFYVSIRESEVEQWVRMGIYSLQICNLVIRSVHFLSSGRTVLEWEPSASNNAEQKPHLPPRWPCPQNLRLHSKLMNEHNPKPPQHLQTDCQSLVCPDRLLSELQSWVFPVLMQSPVVGPVTVREMVTPCGSKSGWQTCLWAPVPRSRIYAGCLRVRCQNSGDISAES